MPNNIYYVYEYHREKDSENTKAGTPYYVGKGKGRRAFDKHGRIHVHKDKLLIVFIAKNMSEEDAFNLEISVIQEYGRKDLGTGILWNLTNGGEGMSGHTHSPETIERRVISIRGGKWFHNPDTNKSLRRHPVNVPEGFIPGRYQIKLVE